MSVPGRRTVLVVEDDPMLLPALGEMLDAAGYCPLLADGAQSALSLLQHVRPDVIVSDIVMPGLDGYGLLARVRQMSDIAAVPFLFLSAKGERDEIREGMMLGADDYIAKPFTGDELVRAIVARLDRRKDFEAVQARQRQDWVGTLAATLHHELRTPLAEIAAYAELLAEAGESLEAGDFHSIVTGLGHGVERLSSLVGDVLLLADLSSGRARSDFLARRRPCGDWTPVVESVVARFDGMARERGIRVTGLCTLGGVVEIDSAYLGDALGRLVDNAIKFSPQGGEVKIVAGPSRGLVVFEVMDSGPGFDPEQVDRLLQPLEQGERTSYEQQGMGNGLAISRALVELHGGQLRATVLAEGGSKFSIELPTIPGRALATGLPVGKTGP